MAYSVPNTFADGDVVDIDDINENFKAARDYLNAGVAIADILDGSITTEDLLVGEPVGVTDDYLFTSGDMYTSRQVDTSFNRNAYFSATVKGSEPYGWPVYQPIPDTGKRFFMERVGNVIIECMLCPLAPHDTSIGVDKTWIAGDNQFHVDDNIYLEVDGVIDDFTKSYTFEERGPQAGGTAGSQSIAAAVNAAHGTSTPAGRASQRPFFTSHLTIGLAKGWHEIRFVYNSRNDKSHVRSRQTTIEIFYKDTNN